MNEDDGGGSSRLCCSVACGENELEIILRMHRWRMIDCAMGRLLFIRGGGD